ncbi:MAG TPA: type II toxin-antitoxin system HicB family antitoxin [Terriglobales bacterium]|nr:type II toxin-antitoxin system HicB family antitoxin [Terriglobales bacterium]
MEGKVHEEVLQVANAIARQRPDWTFSPAEVVNRLRHLNENSVRTHIVSRCCKNAPKNHLHRWGYFRRVARGKYQIDPAYRVTHAQENGDSRRASRPEPAPTHAAGHNTIHVVVRKEDRAYVAECMEIAVVTQGATLDELVGNLGEAVSLHLEGEDLSDSGLAAPLRIQIILEMPLAA